MDKSPMPPKRFKKVRKITNTTTSNSIPDSRPEPPDREQKFSQKRKLFSENLRGRSGEDEETDAETERSKSPGNGNQSKRRKTSATSSPKTPAQIQAGKRHVDDDEERSKAPDTKLIEHLKELFEMERILRKTDPLVVELVMGSSADPKYSDGWKEVGRGTLLLKEGLRTITQARKSLRFTDYADDDSTPEHL